MLTIQKETALVPRPYILPFVSQKGGAGKTTSSANVAAVLAGEMGYRVLAIDLDPQAALTLHLGVRRVKPGHTTREVLVGTIPIHEAIIPTQSGIFLVPAQGHLAAVGTEIVSYAEQRLERAIEPLFRLPPDDKCDFIILDCPPSLDLLPLNALNAAHGVVIPITPEALSAATLPKVLRTIQEVKTLGRRHDLRVLGILPCKAKNRTLLTQAIMELVPQLAPGVPVFPAIRDSVKVAEAPGKGQTLLQHLPRHPAMDDYRRATVAILSRISPDLIPDGYVIADDIEEEEDLEVVDVSEALL